MATQEGEELLEQVLFDDNEMVWQACKPQNSWRKDTLAKTLDIAPLHGYHLSKLNKTCSFEPSLPDTGYTKLGSTWTNKVLCHSHLSAKYPIMQHPTQPIVVMTALHNHTINSGTLSGYTVDSAPTIAEKH